MVNSEVLSFQALKNFYNKFSIDFSWEYYLTTIGMPISEVVRKLYADIPLLISFENFQFQRKSEVSKYLDKHLTLMPGLSNLLTYVKQKNISTAITTSGSRSYIQKYLDKFRLTKYFNTIVTIDEVKQGKPNPDVFLKVLEITGIERKNTIILEDSFHGIDAANRAGIFSIAIPTKGIDNLLYKKAGIVAESLDVVLTLLSLILD